MTLPCDQRAHSVIKRAYYKLLAVNPELPMDPAEKFRRWREAFWSLRLLTIRGYFKDCGLIGAEPAESVARRLFAEGTAHKEQHLSKHSGQLRAYLTWRQSNDLGFDELTSDLHFLRGSRYWPVMSEFIQTDT